MKAKQDKGLKTDSGCPAESVLRGGRLLARFV